MNCIFIWRRKQKFRKVIRLQICSLMVFYQERQIQDFPVRDKRVRLFVKRRRRKEQSTGKSVSKDWDLVARCTRHSKEFTAFLKGLLGERPD